MYLREDGTPYYIGKGKGNRAYQKRRKGIKRPVDIQRIQIVHSNLTENEAFDKEKKLISEYGRKDLNTGILLNRTNGGDGASGAIIKGRKLSLETRKQISERQKGKKAKVETKERMSESHKKRWATMNHSDKLKIHKKISDGNKGKVRNKEQKDKVSEWFTDSFYINNGVENKRLKKGLEIPNGWVKGRMPYNFKRVLSEETKRKIGFANSVSLKGNIPWNKGKKGVQVSWNKGKKRSEETKRKISEAHKEYHRRKKVEESRE
jgi:hypothetical protein